MKRILILCALAFAVQAEPLPSQPGEGQAKPLGRLFYTPAQRAQLDTARKTMPMNSGAAEETPSAPDYNLNGIVTRSDGKRSVWMNNRMEHGAIKSGSQTPMQVQIPGGEVKLKVGQSIDPATGQVIESYRRPPPAPVVTKITPPKAAPSPELNKPIPKAQDDDTETERRAQ